MTPFSSLRCAQLSRAYRSPEPQALWEVTVTLP